MKLSLVCTVSLVLLGLKILKAEPNPFFRLDYEYVDRTNAFYKVHCRPRPWLQAVQACALEGASILTPKDFRELTTVLPLISGDTNLWLGYHTLQKETNDKFYAINDEKNFHLNWGPGQPAKGFKYCVFVYNTQYYGTENCGTKMQFVCKRDPAQNRLGDTRYGIDQSYKRGYTYSPKSNAYFKIHLNPVTWIDAVVKCAEEGAMLASPLDGNELQEILEYSTKEYVTDVKQFVWIGVHGLYTERLFQHLNYEENPSTFTKWHKNEPNNAGGREDCLELYADGTYNDIACNTVKRFVCRNDEFTSSLLRRLRCCEKPDILKDFDTCRFSKRFLNFENLSNNVAMNNYGSSSLVKVHPSRNHTSSSQVVSVHPIRPPPKGTTSSTTQLFKKPSSRPTQGPGSQKQKDHNHPKNYF